MAVCILHICYGNTPFVREITNLSACRIHSVNGHISDYTLYNWRHLAGCRIGQGSVDLLLYAFKDGIGISLVCANGHVQVDIGKVWITRRKKHEWGGPHVD